MVKNVFFKGNQQITTCITLSDPYKRVHLQVLRSRILQSYNGVKVTTMFDICLEQDMSVTRVEIRYVPVPYELYGWSDAKTLLEVNVIL